MVTGTGTGIGKSVFSAGLADLLGARILGIAFIGERNTENESAICEIGRVRWLGRLPWLSPLAADTLQAAFKVSFRRAVSCRVRCSHCGCS